MKKLLIICGPTGTGKTKLAISLAKQFNGELISADSRQVYQGLDALTGKDRSEEVPIWLYDVAQIHEVFTVAHFVRLAEAAIDNIYKRKKLPIVVGGTGFYLRALITSIDTIAVPPNPALRETLRATSLDRLQEQLRRCDRDRWSTMNESDQKNPRRLIRAIEVARSAPHARRVTPRYDTLQVGLTSPLPVLKQRITERVAMRFDNAVTEVCDGLPPILGADPLLSFKREEISKEETLMKWMLAEYQYAKRQMTWFNKQTNVHWFAAGDKELLRKVEAFVTSWYTHNV